MQRREFLAAAGAAAVAGCVSGADESADDGAGGGADDGALSFGEWWTDGDRYDARVLDVDVLDRYTVRGETRDVPDGDRLVLADVEVRAKGETTIAADHTEWGAVVDEQVHRGTNRWPTVDDMIGRADETDGREWLGAFTELADGERAELYFATTVPGHAPDHVPVAYLRPGVVWA